MEPVAIDEFLAQTLDASNLQLTYKASASIPLRGMKALHGVRVNGASVKRGDRVQWDVPPPPSIPQLPAPMPAPAPLTQQETTGLIDYGTARQYR